MSPKEVYSKIMLGHSEVTNCSLTWLTSLLLKSRWLIFIQIISTTSKTQDSKTAFAGHPEGPASKCRNEDSGKVSGEQVSLPGSKGIHMNTKSFCSRSFSGLRSFSFSCSYQTCLGITTRKYWYAYRESQELGSLSYPTVRLKKVLFIAFIFWPNPTKRTNKSRDLKSRLYKSEQQLSLG